MSEVKTGRRSTDNPSILRPDGQWQKVTGGVYRCMVYLVPEEEGFSVVAANLPGVASQGDTEPEALANVIEAFQGAIAVYKQQGVNIPWTKTPLEPQHGAVRRWVIVHA